MATCHHCGEEYLDNKTYCPYCGEPKPKKEKTIDEMYVERKVGIARFWSIFGGVLLQLICLIFMGPVLGLVFGMLIFPVCIWAIIYGIKKKTTEDIRINSRDTIIKKQFLIDKTSICPICGSHNVKIYRKGYDYSVGFWGSIFGVRGSGYAGGFDANKARCRCLNCGNDWLTDYDYRLL